MATTPLIETGDLGTPTSLFYKFSARGVNKVEELQDPAIPTDYAQNINTELLIQKIRNLVDIGIGSIRVGLELSVGQLGQHGPYTDGLLYIGPGFILTGDYVLQYLVSTVSGITFPTSKSTGCSLLLKISEVRFTSSDDATNLQFTPTSGTAFDTHNEYRLTYEWVLIDVGNPFYSGGIDYTGTPDKITYVKFAELSISAGNITGITNTMDYMEDNVFNMLSSASWGNLIKYDETINLTHLIRQHFIIITDTAISGNTLYLDSHSNLYIFTGTSTATINRVSITESNATGSIATINILMLSGNLTFTNGVGSVGYQKPVVLSNSLGNLFPNSSLVANVLFSKGSKITMFEYSDKWYVMTDSEAAGQLAMIFSDMTVSKNFTNFTSNYASSTSNPASVRVDGNRIGRLKGNIKYSAGTANITTRQVICKLPVGLEPSYTKILHTRTLAQEASKSMLIELNTSGYIYVLGNYEGQGGMVKIDSGGFILDGITYDLLIAGGSIGGDTTLERDDGGSMTTS